MEYLTFTLLFIAATAGTSATFLAIIQYIKPGNGWAQSPMWANSDICRFALWGALASAILELYL
jgi:hypothetical protein